ncbi:MAG TPA: AarF/UbiB family protein, partial [Thermoanaerobaculia bacterium]|nr:AarF/UbiB family protein [Thermoanaerobaculia bacterium]
MATIAWVVSRHALAYFVGRWSGGRLARYAALRRVLPGLGLSPPEQLRAVLEDLGGTFIKFGQMLALQPDILPLAYCNALFDLLDRVAPFPFADVERVCREDLGAAPHELFDVFEEQPIATASIGQVHVAWIAGKKLAVKVQRPQVEVEFGNDIRLMNASVALVRRLRIARLYWVIEPMSEFAAWTREELDYRNEARYMERLRANAADNPFETVPAVLAERTSRRVLTADFLSGTTVLDYLRANERGDELLVRRLEAEGFDREAFARHLVDNFLGDAFRHGVFHADLHPANLMVLPESVVGYIDFGITGVLSRYSRWHLVTMTLAYTRADVDGMCDAFLRVSTMDEKADARAFRDGLVAFADSWYERQGGGSRLRKNFTLVMLDMMRLSRQTGVWPERDVVKYIRSSIAIDGLITRFAPGFDLGAYLATVCDRTIRREARKELLSRDRMLAWADANTRLLTDGAARATVALDRVGRPRRPPKPRASPGARERPALRAQALQLGAVALLMALVAVTGGGRGTLGLNVFTAGAAISVAAL